MSSPQPVLKPIAVSTGDPAGIGPEISLKAYSALRTQASRVRLHLYGDRAHLLALARQLSLTAPATEDIVDLGPIAAGVEYGAEQRNAGDAAFKAIVAAATDTADGRTRALVTAPISKAALHLADHDYPGHTELLAEIAGGVPVRMMLANHELRAILVTVHLALRAAIDALTTPLILQTLQIAHQSLIKAGISTPRLAVAGLNPHAGEGGMFGHEESELIAPAVAAARAEGIDASGPFPPDTIFMRARGLHEFDAVVAMYHDQGLIPIKYLGLDQGVNITLGLPFIRTSPDHGTAYDIAGKGVADPASLLEAIRQADQLSCARAA